MIPMYERLVVEKILEDSLSPSGLIHIPEQAQERPTRGKVLLVGPGRLLADGTLKPLTVKVGDEILFGKYTGSLFRVNGREVLLLREDDVHLNLSQGEGTI